MKKCPACKQTKQLSSFHKNRARKDGVNTYCKDCYSKKTYKKSRIAENNRLYKKGQKRCTMCLDVIPLSGFYSVGGRIKQPCKKCCLEKEKVYRGSESYRENRENRVKAQEKKRNSFIKKGSKLIKQVPAIDKPKIKDGFLSVECKSCKNRMFPTYQQALNRIRAFNGDHHGEMNLYCSDKCKAECVVFHFNTRLQVDPRSELYVEKTEAQKARAAQTDKLKKAQCLEVGYNYCERCGDIIDVELHHTLPVSEYGMESIDHDSHMLLCPGCHVALHREVC